VAINLLLDIKHETLTLTITLYVSCYNILSQTDDSIIVLSRLCISTQRKVHVYNHRYSGTRSARIRYPYEHHPAKGRRSIRERVTICTEENQRAFQSEGYCPGDLSGRVLHLSTLTRADEKESYECSDLSPFREQRVHILPILITSCYVKRTP
jgi:hypothetical protein